MTGDADVDARVAVLTATLGRVRAADVEANAVLGALILAIAASQESTDALVDLVEKMGC